MAFSWANTRFKAVPVLFGKWRFPGQIHVSQLYSTRTCNLSQCHKYELSKKAAQPKFFFTRVCTVFHRVNRNTLTFPFTLWMGSTTTATALSESASKLCGNKKKIKKKNGYKIAFTLITSLEKNLFLIWVTMFHKRGWLISRSLSFSFSFRFFFLGGGRGEEEEEGNDHYFWDWPFQGGHLNAGIATFIKNAFSNLQ